MGCSEEHSGLSRKMAKSKRIDFIQNGVFSASSFGSIQKVHSPEKTFDDAPSSCRRSLKTSGSVVTVVVWPDYPSVGDLEESKVRNIVQSSLVVNVNPRFRRNANPHQRRRLPLSQVRWSQVQKNRSNCWY